MPKLKVGDKVWLFDFNRRVYGKESSAPIYEQQFYQDVIEGETSRSWIIGRRKFAKNNPIGIYTDEQKADKIWDNSVRYKIQDKVGRCSTEQLKQIDLILAERKE